MGQGSVARDSGLIGCPSRTMWNPGAEVSRRSRGAVTKKGDGLADEKNRSHDGLRLLRAGPEGEAWPENMNAQVQLRVSGQRREVKDSDLQIPEA